GPDRTGGRAHRAFQPGPGVDRHAAAVHRAPDLDRATDRSQGHARRRRAHPRDRLRLLPLWRVPVVRLEGHHWKGNAVVRNRNLAGIDGTPLAGPRRLLTEAIIGLVLGAIAIAAIV